jgi:lipopolysaccharide transport system permease protein
METRLMNPHVSPRISLIYLLQNVWRYRDLIIQMTRRDVIGRYKGSYIGIIWSFLNPLLMLVLYTLVFSVVFKARWDTVETGDKVQYAILLFMGMIVHSLFSETLLRAPTLILNNVNYVKKIVFPLEIFPIVAMGNSIFHSVISLLILLAALLLHNGFLPWTSIFLPFVLFPLIVFSLGVAWSLASLGVFLRDVAQPIGIVITALLFASPIFYPLTALPEDLRPWMMLNPLTFIIEQARVVLIYGDTPNYFGMLIYFIISIIVSLTGYAWFQKTRKGFANVL